MSVDLQTLYNIAKEHKDNHKSCGGEPYKSYERLKEIVESAGAAAGRPTDLTILEVGTAVGFTTFILQNKNNFVDTIEFHQDHIDMAKENISAWGGDTSKINFFTGDALEILPYINPDTKYDLIFFDGYGAKLNFYNDFKRLLKVGGLLITANQHLKSTEREYFKELQDEKTWEFIEEFADTKVYKKIS
jgi:predicted O-methyltransferase YrrM